MGWLNVEERDNRTFGRAAQDSLSLQRAVKGYDRASLRWRLRWRGINGWSSWVSIGDGHCNYGLYLHD